MSPQSPLEAPQTRFPSKQPPVVARRTAQGHAVFDRLLFATLPRRGRKHQRTFESRLALRLRWLDDGDWGALWRDVHDPRRRTHNRRAPGNATTRRAKRVEYLYEAGELGRAGLPLSVGGCCVSSSLRVCDTPCARRNATPAVARSGGIEATFERALTFERFRPEVVHSIA